MSPTPNGPIVQIGYLVENVQEGIAFWSKQLGIGPWMEFRNVTMEGTYRGQPTSIRMHVALGYQGELQIELIEPVNDAPSPYRGADGKVLLGIHHIAWLSDRLEDSVQPMLESGCTIALMAENPTTRVAYLENPAAPAVLYEFIESTATAELIKQGIATSRNWDGSNPVTTIDFEAMAQG